MANSFTKSTKVLLNETSMVPKVSLAGIMNDILAMLRIIPAENIISEISSGSGTQLVDQSTERDTNVTICDYHNKYYLSIYYGIIIACGVQSSWFLRVSLACEFSSQRTDLQAFVYFH